MHIEVIKTIHFVEMLQINGEKKEKPPTNWLQTSNHETERKETKWLQCSFHAYTLSLKLFRSDTVCQRFDSILPYDDACGCMIFHAVYILALLSPFSVSQLSMQHKIINAMQNQSTKRQATQHTIQFNEIQF